MASMIMMIDYDTALAIFCHLLLYLRMYLVPSLLNTIDHGLFDVYVKPVGHADVLAVAEAHVGEVDEHHLHFGETHNLVLAQVEHLEDVLVQLLIFSSAKTPYKKFFTLKL
jgi:hypothetical protein